MNGFTLWVLMTATGQMGAEPQRDYGWQIHRKDGKLEYIIQISPKDVPYMIQEKQSSEVPPDVAARLSRVVVRVSDEPIVSTPMDEVLRLPVVTAAVLANIERDAGRGRFSDLESAVPGDVRNVSGAVSPPPMPAGGLLASGGTHQDGASAAGNKNDALARVADAMRAPENLIAQNFPNPLGLNADPRSLPAAAQNTTGLPTSTAPLPNAPPAIAQWPGNNGNAARPSGTAGYNLPSTPAATYTDPTQAYVAQGNANNFGGIPRSTTTGSLGTGTLGTGTLGTGTLGTGAYAAGALGQGAYGANVTGTAGSFHGNQTHTANPYGGVTLNPFPPTNNPAFGPLTNSASGVHYSTDPLSLPTTMPVRTADNRNAIIPTTSGSSGRSLTGERTSAGAGALDHTTQNDLPFGTPRSGVENIVPVMFVLSLVVNFYLGMLIRKLLTRYRSLLSSVRSQTT